MFSTMFFWAFSMAGSTVSRRFHCDACGKRQTTSWRNVNYAISQFRCEVWFTLGKQEIPARPNSVDVRVGDKLKVPVVRNNSTPSPKMINPGCHQHGVLWIRNTRVGKKNKKKRAWKSSLHPCVSWRHKMSAFEMRVLGKATSQLRTLCSVERKPGSPRVFQEMTPIPFASVSPRTETPDCREGTIRLSHLAVPPWQYWPL